MTSVPKLFGCAVFNETVMKDRLPTATYKAFKSAVLKGEPLDLPIADCEHYRQRDEGLGFGAGRYAFYALVPADDGDYRRKTRKLYYAYGGWARDYGFQW